MPPPVTTWTAVFPEKENRMKLYFSPGACSMALGRHAACVWCPDGVLDSAAAAAMGKLLCDATTARNWNTVTKLHRLCAEA